MNDKFDAPLDKLENCTEAFDTILVRFKGILERLVATESRRSLMLLGLGVERRKEVEESNLRVANLISEIGETFSMTGDQISRMSDAYQEIISNFLISLEEISNG